MIQLQAYSDAVVYSISEIHDYFRELMNDMGKLSFQTGYGMDGQAELSDYCHCQ